MSPPATSRLLIDLCAYTHTGLPDLRTDPGAAIGHRDQVPRHLLLRTRQRGRIWYLHALRHCARCRRGHRQTTVGNRLVR
eukprot:11967-Eustigmatos_ZCMA.PRE.1